MNAMLNDANINEYSNGNDNDIGNRKVVIVMILKNYNSTLPVNDILQLGKDQSSFSCCAPTKIVVDPAFEL